MRTFPNITLPDPNYSLWFLLAIPVVAAVVFFFSEYLIERWTEKYRGKPVVGIGFVLMGICLFFIPSAIPVIDDTINLQRNQIAVSTLEGLGFKEVRLNTSGGTFGGYYEGKLMRGVLVPVQDKPGEYRVIETPPPS